MILDTVQFFFAIYNVRMTFTYTYNITVPHVPLYYALKFYIYIYTYFLEIPYTNCIRQENYWIWEYLIVLAILKLKFVIFEKVIKVSHKLCYMLGSINMK